MACSWSCLPPELSDLILAHLPSSSLPALQSVCRSWLSSISSPHFRLLHRLLHPPLHPRLLLYTHSVSISSWSPSDRLWHHLTLPTFYVRDWAGSRGLVCLRSHLLSNGYLVGNPLTAAWKTLPDPIDPCVGKIWAMITDASRSDYWILLLHRTSATLQIYSSRSERWVQQPLPRSTLGEGRTSMDLVFSKSASCIGELVYSVQGETRSLLTFDVRRDVWKRVEAGLPPGLTFEIAQEEHLLDTPPKLVQGPKGRTLLVGAYSSGEAVHSIGVVWQLDAARKEWREVARAPLQMWSEMLEEAKEYRKSALMPIRYVGEGEVILVMACGAQRAIEFNLREEKWDWLELPSTANCELTLCFQPPTDATQTKAVFCR